MEAEKKFIPRLQKELGSPQAFQRFRKASKAFKLNKISAKEYLELFAEEIGVQRKGSQLLQELIPGLAALVRVVVVFFFFSGEFFENHSFHISRAS